MQKNSFKNRWHGRVRMPVLIVRAMRITLFLTTICVMNLYATGYSQDPKLTLSLKDVKLSQIFQIIQQKSNYQFLYNDEDVQDAPNVNVSVTDASISQILEACFKNYPLCYKMEDKTVVVVPRPVVAPQVPSTVPAVSEEVQAFTVKGKVTDQDGNPLIGVSVVLKGSQNGTVTDGTGTYSLTIPNGNGTLVFSYIGFASQEVAVGGKQELNVTLQPSSEGLHELVVTALGVKKVKRGLVYSTAELKGSDFTKSRENNIASALTGKVAGVDASQIASGPGGSSRVIIRGVGAINGSANNQPLYVVNGSPIYNGNGGASQNATGINFDAGDGISSINPDDIESITVLKSGAAAALYGSQAANGVILITTKSGAAQQGIGVDFNSNMVWGTPSTYPNYQYKYGSGNNGEKPADQAAALSAGRLSFGAPIDGSMVTQFDGVKRPYSAVHVKDNIKNFYRPSQDITNTLAFHGGSEDINYRFSVSDLNSQGQTPHSSYDRKTTNLAVHSDLGSNNFITIDANAQYNIEKGRNRPTIGYAEINPAWATYLLGNTVDIRSLAPGYDENGNEIQWNPVPAAPNPWFIVNKMGNEDKGNRFIGSANVKVNLLKNLYIQGLMSKDFSFKEMYDFVPMGTAFTPKGYYDSYQQKHNLTDMRATINYNGTWHDFSVDAFVGGDRERIDYLGTGISGRDFIIPNFISYTNLTTLDVANTDNPIRAERPQGTNSLFGSLDLDYKKIVYLSVTGRKDWFSTLNPGHNGIFYPSVGASAILSDAMHLPKVINFLKIRASWAQVGNATVDPFAIVPAFTLRTGGFNGVPVLDAPNRLLNPDIRPLTVTTAEGGFVIQFFDNRLGLDATYYDRKTTNNILRPSISAASGYLPGDENVGTLRNRGVELMLTGTPVRSQDFGWDVSFNFAWNKNEILSLAPGLTTLTLGTSISSQVSVITQVGLPYATLQGMVFEKDPNGVQVYNKTSGYEASVKANLGVANPPYLMGLTNTFHYKNFSLNILIDSKFGAVAYSDLWKYATRFGLTKITLPGRENGLQLEGVDQDGNHFSKLWSVQDLDTYYDHLGNNYSGSVSVFKTDFVKIRSLILNYNIPVKKVKFLQSASIALVGRNLAILYRDKRVKEAGLDPEFQQTVNNVTGTSGVAEPVTRNIGFNLSLKF
jgi:TonB-linked SusC/RagA family outer membrane protein